MKSPNVPAPEERVRQARLAFASRTPGRLAEFVTERRRYRTRLWHLFDRVALALLSARLKNVLIMTPPQHGKTEYWGKFFPAWWLGRNPDHRIVLGSYSSTYATSWGRATRDVIDRHGPEVFNVALRDDVTAASEWKLIGREGGMVTAGVETGIAGRPAELAIGDDILLDGESPTEKAKVWRWFEEEFSARLQRGGRRVIIMTRRAVDDPIGRLLKLNESGKEKWTIIRLPAIAEEDENWPEWGWERKMGEALIEDLHPLEELREIERSKGSHAWAGLYQQRPYPRGGGDVKSEWFKVVEADPPEPPFQARAWDLAYSESPSAKRTAGVLMTRRREGSTNKYHISNVVYGRWGPGTRNLRIVEQAKIDGKDVPIIFEEEGGSGGPAQVDELVRLLDGWIVIRSRAGKGGSKELRAMALAAQAQVGNVTIRDGNWLEDFKAEVDSFPAGPTIDMVDASAHAYNWLADQQDIIEVSDFPMLPRSTQIFPPAPPGGVFGPLSGFGRDF